MDINQLSEKIKSKILNYKEIKNVEIVDKSYLHKNHKSNELGKFHIKLIINSEELKKKIELKQINLFLKF